VFTFPAEGWNVFEQTHGKGSRGAGKLFLATRVGEVGEGNAASARQERRTEGEKSGHICRNLVLFSA